jgi:hypothetical protein
MNLKHPSQYWTEYNGEKTQTPRQQREIRKAFHAGIEATFDFLLSFKHNEETAEQIAEDLRWFRRHNKATLNNLETASRP